ncbi:MAG: aspartyl/asparaginyl beta-hydroxylase domain-containing protein [Planctomycetes bacterium]|nr:aspartyl/asparaginyl beta-hydroxylase domain-containing protein [Planctomycetota bacterium]
MNRDEFLEGLLAADRHDGGLRCRRLFRVDAQLFASLRHEVADLRDRCKPSVVGERSHVTNWAGPRGEVLQYSLLNASGRTDDFASDHDLSTRNKWFFDAVRWPALSDWITTWPDVINFRVHVLAAGAALEAHEEHVPFRTKRGGVGARLRFHLPIETNPEAELNLDGAVHHLEAGAVFLVNQGCVHSTHNRGAAPRVHLVWDSFLTSATFAFLFEASDPRLEPATPEVDVLRHEPLATHRRLMPAVARDEAAAMDVCESQ